MLRRDFILSGLSAILLRSAKVSQPAEPPSVMTVNGPVPAAQLGFTLSHEHVLVDFIGVKEMMPAALLRNDALQKIIPPIKQVQNLGCRTLIECTPYNLGRDPLLLQQISAATGMHILTNTGYYGAVAEKYLPPAAFAETAPQLATRWIREWENGIGDTGIKPGFIKSGVDKGPLTVVQRKLIQAACITHLATGLPIGVHSGDGAAALQELAIIEEMEVSPTAWIWIHAQNEPEHRLHFEAAQKGGWISFDGCSEGNVPAYVNRLVRMKAEGLLSQVLVSQDAGWYQVGKEKGGDFRTYSSIFTHLIPALSENGFSATDLQQIFVVNPARAFSIAIRNR